MRYLEHDSTIELAHSLIQAFTARFAREHQAAVASLGPVAVNEKTAAMMNDRVTSERRHDCVSVDHLLESNALVEAGMGCNVDAAVVTRRNDPAALRVSVGLFVINLGCCRKPP